MRRALAFVLLCAALAHGGRASARDSDDAGRGGSAAPVRERVVILANADAPGSTEVARYYAEKRSIPEANIVALPMPREETISLRSFVEAIFNPLRNTLAEHGWIDVAERRGTGPYGREALRIRSHRIAYLVVCRGVPVRFKNDPSKIDPETSQLPKQFQTNRAAVDSELALLAAPLQRMVGPIPNPLQGKLRPPEDALAQLVRVSRLDGPTHADAKALVDRALEGERVGLAGRGYFDVGGRHPKGDKWIRKAAKLAREAHFDVAVEDTEAEMNGADRVDAPAIYMGWYRNRPQGPWANDRLNVPAGAIGFHLHSFSAKTIRSPDRGWVGPLVDRGFAVTVGNVYEPYLEFTHRPDQFLEALLEGRTWGEAVYYSLPALSWQNLAIGDPLYRPAQTDLRAQLAMEEKPPHYAYAVIRRMNELRAQGESERAVAEGRERFAEAPSLPLAYELARLYAEQGGTREAREVLGMVRHIARFAWDELMLARDAARLIRELGDAKWAYDVYAQLVEARERMAKPARIQVLREAAEVARGIGRDSKARAWRTEAGELAAPPESKEKSG